jgi:ABC-type multidrug transport system fused ATPase/permease subunit
MIPTDPKEAANIGKAWGEAITDSVFGIVDTVRNAPAQKAANNQKIINRNKITEINNQVIKNNNALREQAMREIAAEQEATMLARMTPAQRQAFHQARADAAHAAHKAKVEAQRKKEEFWEIFWALFFIFVVFPFLVWVGLIIWGISDVMACYSMKGFIPFMKAICGH